MKNKSIFACWAACLSLGCLALSGCTTTQAQADADDVVAAGALPTATTCTKGQATSCPVSGIQCTKGDAAKCCKGGDWAGCRKNKQADSDK